MPASHTTGSIFGSPTGYAVTIVGVPLVLACDAPAKDVVTTLLAPWGPMAVENAPPDLLVSTDGRMGRFRLVARDAGAWTCIGRESLAVAVQDWLDTTVASRVSRLTPVHAGVVAIDGRVLLLPASSGAGKTTLVAALVARGAVYYSDEIAFVDPDGFVHAYPRHRVVRTGTGERRSASRGWPGEAAPGPARASHVIALQYASGASLALEPILSSEALLLLLAHTTATVSPAIGAPASLLNVVRHAAAFRGVRGEVPAAADQLMQLAVSGPA